MKKDSLQKRSKFFVLQEFMKSLLNLPETFNFNLIYYTTALIAIGYVLSFCFLRLSIIYSEWCSILLFTDMTIYKQTNFLTALNWHLEEIFSQ